MSSFNAGDMLFQLFFLGFLVWIISLIVSFFRSRKKQKIQMDLMEKKIDSLTEQLKKSE